jgi:hypothetical protein
MASRVFGLIEVSGLADELPVNPVNFKQLSVQETLYIPAAKPDVEQIVSVSAEVVIKCTNVITTPVGTSEEGQILTGKKLIIEGIISQKVEYVADEPTQSVHAAHFNMPFSAFIVLPATFQKGTPVEVKGYIEDIFIELLDKRTIFKNVTILLDARF